MKMRMGATRGAELELCIGLSLVRGARSGYSMYERHSGI